MNKVISKDGTTIAFDRTGEGPAIILVDGALCYRGAGPMGALAAHLAPSFTVFTYDRRGRGDSGDTQPYSVEREIEDIEALVDEAGEEAFLYGISSGAVLALHAAGKLSTRVKKLALYEPPFIVDNSRPPLPEDYVQQINTMVREGRRGDAVALFMHVVGIPDEAIAGMRHAPMWPGLEAVAHTLAYDGIVMGDTQSGKPLPAGSWASVTMPTLVMDGGASPAFMHNGAQDVAAILPNARLRTLEGQTHEVASEAIAPVLEEFFLGR